MTAQAPGAADPADRVLRLVRQRPPTLGTGRLVCIDGPAASGKSTLAGTLAAISGAPVVPVDDLLEGWTGLGDVHRTIGAILTDLAAGRTARWRRWDWHGDRRADEHTLVPGPLVVLEGVGSGQRAWAPLTTVLVWVEAPPDVRLRRGLARDGDGLREHWEQWTADEGVLFGSEDTRARADLVISTADRGTAQLEEEHT